jgi:phenylalanyl-tRNA synthetase beta chain
VKQAAILIDGGQTGVVGEVHPAVLEAFNIPGPVYLFEISLPVLLPFVQGHRMFQPIPRFPAMLRDIALVVDAATAYQKVVDVIRGFPLVEQVSLFDVYSGNQVPSGKKSLACRITYQSLEHTLTDEEVNRVQQKILDRLSRELREKAGIQPGNKLALTTWERNGQVCCITMTKVEELTDMVKAILGPVMREIL